MKKRLRKKKESYKQREQRTRSKIFGTPERPRLTVRRSNKHIYAQIVNDLYTESLVQVSDLSPSISDEVEGKTKTEKSRIVGKKIGELALDQGIDKVVFDKGGYEYHGRVEAVAEGAREAGLNF